MSPEREREYAELLAFVDFIATHVWRIDPADPAHPASAGRRIVAEFGKAKAFEGLRQAVNDIIEQLADAPVEFQAHLDGALRERGVLSFSEVRRRYAAAYRRIVKRGRIASEREYYLVRGLLADVSSVADEDARRLLEAMLDRYERSV